MALLNDPLRQTRLVPLIGVLLSIPILYFAKGVLIPLALAALLSFLLSPSVKLLERLRLGRALPVGLVVVLALFTAALVGWVVTNQLVDAISHLADYRHNIEAKVEAIRNRPESKLTKATNSVEQLNNELSGPASNPQPTKRQPGEGSSPAPRVSAAAGRSSSSNPKPVPVEVVDKPPTMMQAVRNVSRSLLEPLATALVVIVFTAFMLMNRADLRDRLIRLVAPGHLNVMTQAFDEAAQRISRYLMTQLVINTSFAAMFATGLFFIGLPNAVLWGALAGLVRFVPYLGTFIGGLTPFILAVAIFPGWAQPMLVFTLFFVIELSVANFIEPWAYGTTTGVSALAILVAAVFWTTLWGWAGLILSTPLTVCVVVLGRYVPQLDFLRVLLGDEPVLSPESRFYQRLLAMDPQEARTLVDEFLKDHTLLELYDQIVIPALRLAEEDRHKGTLDVARENFIVESIYELVGELQATEAEAGSELRPPAASIVCLAARDRADHLAATAFSQMLERAGYSVVSRPLEASLETVDFKGAGGHSPEIVCISAVPPFSLLNARSLSRRLREQYPELKIIVGLWNFSGGGKKASERLGKAFAEPVVTTFAEAIREISAFNDAAATVSAASPTERYESQTV